MFKEKSTHVQSKKVDNVIIRRVQTSIQGIPQSVFLKQDIKKVSLIIYRAHRNIYILLNLKLLEYFFGNALKSDSLLKLFKLDRR